MPLPLSWPFVDWPERSRYEEADGREVIDAVVIGSGYGGSVAALRLAEEGKQVIVLERGSEYLPGDFPNDVGQLPKYVRAHAVDGTLGSLCGLFDFRYGTGMAALVANGLGGGSLINAGVMMRPQADVFMQPAWPAEFRMALDAGPASDLGLDAAFERAQAMLRGEVFHDPGKSAGTLSELPKAKALRRIGAVLARDGVLGSKLKPPIDLDFEAHPATVTIDLDKCTRCGDCMTGCNVPGAKKTLATTYLAHASKKGAQIVTRCLVYSIAPDDDRWTLRVMPTEFGQHARRLADVDALHGTTLSARLVVVAAGTFGSTELLLRSRQLAGRAFPLSPTLGSRLTGNGDSVSALADLKECVDGLGHGADRSDKQEPVGPTITSLIDLRGHPSIEKRIVVQEGAAPGALVRTYQELIATAWTFRHIGVRDRKPRHPKGADPCAASRDLARHAQMLLVMGHDGSAGHIEWVPEMDGARPHWDRPDEAATHRRQQELFDAAERASGGVHLHTPLWRLLSAKMAALIDGPMPSATALSVHPLGGCAMSDRFECGVVNHLGRVWKAPHAVWDSLYVLDGSIVPTSLGCNPLWTIAALAERSMAHRPASDERTTTAADQPTVSRPDVARAPEPLVRDAPPRFDMHVSERLLKRRLRLRGALRRAMQLDDVESDLRVRMRASHWAAKWDDDSNHRFDQVSGSLRLVETEQHRRDRAASISAPSAQPAQSDPRPHRLDYRIAGGSVTLFGAEHEWPVWGRLIRFERSIRSFLTWLLMRGWRDQRDRRRNTDVWWWDGLRTLMALCWQAAEPRRARYDLRLELTRAEGADRPPQALRLQGSKFITYPAAWHQIVRHLMIRSWHAIRRSDPSDKRRPTELRASLFVQLTQPEIRLDPVGRRSALPAWLANSTRGGFEFDQQEGLQRPAVKLYEGGDSSAAVPALLAYPALLARYLVATRVLEFRQPTYSRKPLADDATSEDVALRVRSKPGASEPSFLLRPDEIELSVKRGRSSSDDGTEDLGNIALRLWRYPRIDFDDRRKLPPECTPGDWCGIKVTRAKSVLLMHAFDMSGYSYTFKTTERNFAEHLYSQGWEVWILDSRMSPRTRASIEPCTIDQLGLIDAPAAVDCILEKLRCELRVDAEKAPLQIYSFAHCVGAAAMLIALLRGRLAHRIGDNERIADARFRSTGGEDPRLPKLAGLVTSQVHPFLVGSGSAQSKTWIPALLRNIAGRTLVPLAVRGAVESVAEAWADRAFAALPVPKGENCPKENAIDRHDDDDCATCRRIRFILGGVYAHRHLNWETHRALPKLFGAGNVRLFAQAAKFFEYERLVSEDGFNVYATDEAMGRYLALPIRFVHGNDNDLFDCESATRSADQYLRIHPRWVERWGATDRAGKRRVCDVIDGYGHLDGLIGRYAMRPDGPYDRYSRLLNEAWSEPVAMPADRAPQALVRPFVVRFPKAGPFLGPIVEEDGRRSVGIAFVVDDTSAEATRGRYDVSYVLVRHGNKALCSIRLEEFEVPVPIPALDGYAARRRNADVGIRVAYGTVPLDGWDERRPLRLECVSYKRAAGVPSDAFGERGGLAASVDAGVDLMPMRGEIEPIELPAMNDAPPVSVEAPAVVARVDEEAPSPMHPGDDDETKPHAEPHELRAAIAKALWSARKNRHRIERPYPTTRSAWRSRVPGNNKRKAFLWPHVAGTKAADEVVRWAAGCCRYGGFPFDRDRADASFRRLFERMRLAEEAPQMLMMLGDQIYADRTAGIVDALSPIERFLFRHQEAFTTPGLHALMSRLPTLCLPDDHEFIDSYPLGRPLFRGRADRKVSNLGHERAARSVATHTLQAFQMKQAPATLAAEGWCSFRRGEVEFFAFDARTQRRRDTTGAVTLVTPAAHEAFRRWAREGNGDGRLHVLLTSSVVLPSLILGANPAFATFSDTFQASEPERRCILDTLVANLPGRFLLVSGDYHLTVAGELRVDGQTVGATIVVPSFYGPLPYVNATPEDLWLDEAIALNAGQLKFGATHGGATLGSGYGLIACEKRNGAWAIDFSAELQDFDRAKPWQSKDWPTLYLGGTRPIS